MSLIAGMYLSDHLGDVARDVFEAAQQAGFITKEQADKLDTMADLGKYIARRYGATSIWGTSLRE